MQSIHGFWCDSKTFPTKCSHCKEAVYYFSCNCGSRVFFDQLGPPWPIHDCDTSWTRNLKRTFGPNGQISVELVDGVSVIRSFQGFDVDAAFLVKAKKADEELQRPANHHIRRVDPPKTGVKQLIGVLRELHAKVDAKKALDLPDTDIALAFLGQRWAKPVGRITVHGDAPNNDGLESYTTWIPSSYIVARGIERGIAVQLTLASVPIPNSKYVWFCEEFEPLI